MKEKLLLIGSGGFGRVVLEHAINVYECAFLDDREIATVNNTKVIGKISELEKFFPEFHSLLVTIGNNTLREKLYRQAREIGYTFPNIIHSSAYISPHAILGRGVIILNNVVIQNNAKCGDGCIINPGVELHQDSKIGNYCLIYTNSVVRSLACVGNRVWIGSTATIGTSATVPDDGRVEDGDVIKA